MARTVLLCVPQAFYNHSMTCIIAEVLGMLKSTKNTKEFWPPYDREVALLLCVRS